MVQKKSFIRLKALHMLCLWPISTCSVQNFQGKFSMHRQHDNDDDDDHHYFLSNNRVQYGSIVGASQRVYSHDVINNSKSVLFGLLLIFFFFYFFVVTFSSCKLQGCCSLDVINQSVSRTSLSIGIGSTVHSRYILRMCV